MNEDTQDQANGNNQQNEHSIIRVDDLNPRVENSNRFSALTSRLPRINRDKFLKVKLIALAYSAIVAIANVAYLVKFKNSKENIGYKASLGSLYVSAFSIGPIASTLIKKPTPSLVDSESVDLEQAIQNNQGMSDELSSLSSLSSKGGFSLLEQKLQEQNGFNLEQGIRRTNKIPSIIEFVENLGNAPKKAASSSSSSSSSETSIKSARRPSL